ncbi:MAG: hypothetical protein SGI73_14510 [Chloroflexota bacterium]|nr:hypothetical protein [Chloroflexota bacterium]
MNRNRPKNDVFMQCVSAHEQGWGKDTYRGRPTLKQVLEAKVISFWEPVSDELPPTITLHPNLKDVEKYLLSLVMHSTKQIPRLRLAKVFLNQREVKIKNVRVVFDFDDLET